MIVIFLTAFKDVYQLKVKLYRLSLLSKSSQNYDASLTKRFYKEIV